MKEAKLTINIWSDGKKSLRVKEEDLPREFVQHLEHIKSLCEQEYTCGEVCGEYYSGWWKIESN